MTPGSPESRDPLALDQTPQVSNTSRLQRILFWSLLGGIVLMALLLYREHRAEQQRYTNLNEIMPLSAPYVDTENVTFAMANDASGAINAVQQDVALPQDPVIRARALLDRLFVEYALPTSTHPLPTGAAIDDLFLVKLPLPGTPGSASSLTTSGRGDLFSQPGLLAVVSLRGTFVQNHPSGIAVEDLTLRSIIGTLHANSPQIQQVRFLVDGQPHDTLAGHADLSRTYPAIDTTGTPIQPSADDSSNPEPTDSDTQ